MKICAVICEFNPFHNGHKHLLSEAKVKSGCDAILCIMSGNFVQRAEPACVPKEVRTHFALSNGADFVVELPFMYATASAELFAKGAVQIISKINNITHISFGCEDMNLNLLKAIADVQTNESSNFKDILNLSLSTGMSYPSAYSKATSKVLKDFGFESTMCDTVLSKPNNLLAIEYLKQLNKQNVDLQITPILRIGSDYNDLAIKDNYSSASALRQKLKENDLISIKQNVPENTVDMLLEHSKTISLADENLSNLIIYALRNYPLESLLDVSEGIEKRLKKNAVEFSDLDNILSLSKTKRYTFARLKRICLQALFSITKEDIQNSPIAPVRLLGIRNTFKSEIKSLSDSLIIQSKDYEKLDKNLYKRYIQIEEKAANIYSLIRRANGGSLYSYKLVTCD